MVTPTSGIEVTSCLHVRLKVPINSCITELDRIGVRECRLTRVACSPQGRKHTLSEFRRAMTSVIAIEKREGCNFEAKRERL